VAYAVFGTSRHLIINPDAATWLWSAQLAMGALWKIGREIEEGQERVADADLKGFLGSVSYEKLLTLDGQRAADGRILGLIAQMQLRARGQSVETHQGPRPELTADRGSALSLPTKPTVDLMRRLLASIFTLVLTASIALGLDAQTKAEIDELIAYAQTSDVRFIRNGLEYSGAEGAKHLRDKLAKAGDRVKTTEDFITGIASGSFLSGKPYLVKFADGHTQATGERLRGHLTEVREGKR
jgi:hypothetical protein